MSRRTASRVICGLLLTGFTPLLAQQSRLDRDVEFVRKLATDLRFTALAEQEVERLQNAHRDSADFKQIFQLGIEIKLIGARSHPNREERRTLFKEALESSKEFIDRYSTEPVADRARRTMLEACYEYGAYLLEEIDLARSEAPDQVKDLEDQAASVYKDGIAACDQVMDHLRSHARDEGSTEQRDYYVTWLFKGMLEREMARAVKRDRGPLAQIARDTFEEFIFEVGEESLLGLRGWFEMSKIGEVLGNYDEAFESYNDTIHSIHTALDQAAELGLGRDTQEYVFNLLQEAYDRAAEALFQQGKVDETLTFVEQFRTDLKTYGEEGLDPFEIAHPTYGHPVFLTEARALSESGDAEKVSQALTIAQMINDRHPNDITGLRAKNVLKEILEIQSSSIVSGTLLFEVAKGDYQAREYERAIQGFKRAYGAMTDSEKREFGLETWSTIAKCYGLQRRFLEAALAAMHGLDTYGVPPGGAAEEEAADVLERAWQSYLRDAKTNDVSALAALKDKVTRLAAFGGADSAAKLQWREAGRLLDSKQFAQAADAFAKVPTNTPYFEPAQARVVVSWQQAEDHAKARAALNRYLEWLKTPAANIPSDRRELLDTRNQAMATVEFYAAFMDYLEAVGRVGGAPDRTRFEPTITRLRAFISEHGTHGPSYVPNAWDMIARLQAELGQLDKADESYRTLRKLEPNSPLVPALATAIFKAYYDAERALETEYDALVQKGATAAELKPVLARLNDARRKAVASGVDYLENASQPLYSVLFSTMTIAGDMASSTGDMEAWKTSERFGRKIIEVFGNSPDEKENVEKFVTARLGEALLRQRKFRDAVEILQTAANANPNNYPVKRFLSLAQGGWFEFDQRGGLQEVAGLDQPAEAYQRHWTEYRKYLRAREVPDYSLEWYEFECECFMFAARAARKEGKKYEQLRDTHYGRAQSVDDFKTLRALGPKGDELWQLFQTVK